MTYFEEINGILEFLGREMKNISDFKDVSVTIRPDGKMPSFPRLDIILEGEDFVKETATKEYNLVMVNLLLRILVRGMPHAPQGKEPSREVLELTGEVYDLIEDIRINNDSELFDDVWVTSITNFVKATDNFVLFETDLHVVVETRF